MNAAGIADLDDIVDDLLFVFERRIRKKGNVCQEQKTVDTFDLEYTDMAEHLAGTKSDLFVQYAAKKRLGFQKALHIHVRFPVMHELDRSECSLLHIRLIDNADTARVQIPADLLGDLTDLRLITCQDRNRDFPVVRFLYGFHDRQVLRGRNRKFLSGNLTYLFQNFIKRSTHNFLLQK